MLCDDGVELDLRLDPPVAIADAAKRAVRRWRLRRIAEALPALIPDEPDITIPADAGQQTSTYVVDFADVVDKLLQPKARARSTCATFAAWSSTCRGDLTSAICGGQWPQARLAQVRDWTDDNRCQLCLDAVGTLEHRLVCEAICPPTGWQPPPDECSEILERTAEPRLSLLRTRGLYAMKVDAPAPPKDDTFSWALQPPEDVLEGAIWFIDGSLFDEARRYARRTGFGIVITSSSGTLLGYGNGVPPRWVHDAAGAELWALYVVARMNPMLPKVVTDCVGLLQGLQGEPSIATGPKKKLARTWNMIKCALDGDFQVALRQVTWMPSHIAAHAIGSARDSRGEEVTPLMWRANRLADILAKAAASPTRLPTWATKKVHNAAKLVQNYAARLGVATHEANNHKVTMMVDGGATEQRTMRDSTAARPSWRQRPQRGAKRKHNEVVLAPDVDAAPAAVAVSIRCKRRKTGAGSTNERARRRAAACRHQERREALARESQLARWLSDFAPADASPAMHPSAADRRDALKARICAKEAAARAAAACTTP